MTSIYLTVFSCIFALLIFIIKESVPLKEQNTGGNSEKAIQEPQDYSTYQMDFKEKAKYALLAWVVSWGVCYLFYRTSTVALLTFPLCLVYSNRQSKKIARKKREALRLQFRDALYSLTTSLAAGRSMESAIAEGVKDLALLYPNPQDSINREFREILRKIDLNVSVEEALFEFAHRSHVDDIENFVDVFIMTRRSGGNLPEIMRTSSLIISERIRIREEIRTLLSRRILEQKVLNIMPLLLVAVLSWSTGSYMEPVFTTLYGRIVMSAALALLTAAYFISERIIDIDL